MSRSLIGDYIDSFRNPGFWIYSTWLELATKYRRSRLGLFWALCPALIYMFGIGGFFGYLQGHSAAGFIPHLGIGYVLFRLITISLSESTTAFQGHASFILDGRVRLTDYILRVVAKAMFYFVMALPAIAVALVISPTFHPAGLLMSLPAFILVVLNIGWMGAIVAVLGARLQDVHELIGSILMFSFLFTPIIWYADQAPINTVRGMIARANPLYHMIESVRAPMLGEPIEQLTYVYLAVLLLGGWLVASFIYRRYARYVPVWV
ncbi:ABC transporter permease [Stenotrophomonas sp. MH1]|uniref:ABC transporter permease n=1 Tax=Stenotrophomonas capsici TaxID=3110230 RepID=A0ABU5V4L2_9GAMM|nr:ABC transporter permease [Stenotrophomonas sp. MH1]MEA5668251.1 ABC transporter permease [Stenotrophomonas sp. MH1]